MDFVLKGFVGTLKFSWILNILRAKNQRLQTSQLIPQWSCLFPKDLDELPINFGQRHWMEEEDLIMIERVLEPRSRAKSKRRAPVCRFVK